MNQQDKQFVEFARLIFERSEKLPAGPRSDLLALTPYIVRNLISACEFVGRMGGSVGSGGQIDAVCSDGLSFLATVEETSEAKASARLIFTAVLNVLATLDAAPKRGSQKFAFIAGMLLGQADIRVAQVSSGLWDIVAEADANAASARKALDKKRAGGATRGAQLSAKAAEWKAEAMKIAVDLDRKHPEYTRSKLATEITFNAGCEMPEHKSVEDWLKNQAEAPNGPIRSRSRTKTA
jgi:hypothetical protein